MAQLENCVFGKRAIENILQIWLDLNTGFGSDGFYCVVLFVCYN
jgi:hypothetical protein